MIEDQTRPPKPTPRDWAVFRYGLISEATRPLAHEVVSETLSRISARQHQLPDGTLRRFSVATLRNWLRAYQHSGLDALLPKTRADQGNRPRVGLPPGQALAAALSPEPGPCEPVPKTTQIHCLRLRTGVEAISKNEFARSRRILVLCQGVATGA